MTTLTRFTLIDTTGEVVRSFPSIAQAEAARKAGEVIVTTEEKIEAETQTTGNDPFADLL